MLNKTSQKRIEKALRQSNTLYQTKVNNTQEVPFRDDKSYLRAKFVRG